MGPRPVFSWCQAALQSSAGQSPRQAASLRQLQFFPVFLSFGISQSYRIFVSSEKRRATNSLFCPLKKKKTGLPWRLSDRVCLPVSIGDPVRAPILEDLVCLGAAQPMCYSHQASTLEAVLRKRSPLSEKPTPTTRE